MAKRPIFIPNTMKSPYVTERELEFEWHPGFAISQQQKSISSLHKAAKNVDIFPVLEISSKSQDQIGVNLSAFNLELTVHGGKMSVECAFQGSKTFENGGPFTDLYTKSSKEAKKDERLRKSGNVIGFNFFGEEFPTLPLTSFYDWLYIQALEQNSHLSENLLEYNGFTDIAFNPKKSHSCQARSAAQYVGLSRLGLLNKALQGKDVYLSLFENSDLSNNLNQLSFL
jgi:hypothetical protein